MPPPARLLIVYDGKLSGAGRDLVIRQQIQALEDAGYSVDVAARGRAPRRRGKSRPARALWPRLFSLAPGPFYYDAWRRAVAAHGARLAASGRYAAVIGWSWCSAPAFRAARQTGARCALNIGNPFPAVEPDDARPPSWPLLPLSWLREEIALAGLLLAPSAHSAESYQSHGATCRAAVIGRGADLDAFRPPDSPPPGFRAVFFGRVCRRKGADTAVDAWIAAALPGAELWFCGDVDDDCRHLLQQDGRNGIRFLGHQQDPAPILRQTHVHLLLSRREGLAKTTVEAAACGLVNLVTRATGFSMTAGVEGFYVEPGDAAATAALLRQLHADPGLRARMGRAARTLAETAFSWDRMRTALSAEIQRLLAP